MFAMGNIGEMYAQLRAYVDIRMRASIARLVHFTYFSGSSATGTGDSVECDHTDEASGSYAVRRMQHFGFRSRPPKGVAAIRLGNFEAASNSVVVAEDSERYGPGDLADGEVALYNKVTGAEIKIDQDGNITINTPAGKTVQLNGSDYSLPKWDDFYTDVVAWIGVLNTLIGTLVPVTGATGGPAYATAIALPASLIVKMATPTNYKSIKVKNG